jgi:hypothetical protein
MDSAGGENLRGAVIALDVNSYGSVTGVAAYTRRLANVASTFDSTTRPTLVEVEAFLDQASDTLNGWLSRSGYVIPVTQADAVNVMSRYANIGAAGHVELSQRAGGYDAEDENRRENKFLDLFKLAESYIESGALAAMGAAVVSGSLPSPVSGFRVGGGTRSGQALRPIFRRTSFGNNPTAESSGPKESDYTE